MREKERAKDAGYVAAKQEGKEKTAEKVHGKSTYNSVKKYSSKS